MSLGELMGSIKAAFDNLSVKATKSDGKETNNLSIALSSTSVRDSLRIRVGRNTSDIHNLTKSYLTNLRTRLNELAVASSRSDNDYDKFAALVEALDNVEEEARDTFTSYYVKQKIDVKTNNISGIINKIADSTYCDRSKTRFYSADRTTYININKNHTKVAIAILINGATVNGKELDKRNSCFGDFRIGSKDVTIIQKDISELTGVPQRTVSECLNGFVRVGILSKHYSKITSQLSDYKIPLYDINLDSLYEYLNRVESTLSQTILNKLIIDIEVEKRYLKRLKSETYKAIRDITKPICIGVDDVIESGRHKGEYVLGAIRPIIVDMLDNDSALKEDPHSRFIEHGKLRVSNDLCATRSEEHDLYERHEAASRLLGSKNINKLDMTSSIYTLSANIHSYYYNNGIIKYDPFSNNSDNDLYYNIFTEACNSWNKSVKKIKENIIDIIDNNITDYSGLTKEEYINRLTNRLVHINNINSFAFNCSIRDLFKKLIMTPFMREQSARLKSGEYSLLSLQKSCEDNETDDVYRYIEGLNIIFSSITEKSTDYSTKTRFCSSLRQVHINGKTDMENRYVIRLEQISENLDRIPIDIFAIQIFNNMLIDAMQNECSVGVKKGNIRRENSLTCDQNDKLVFNSNNSCKTSSYIDKPVMPKSSIFVLESIVTIEMQKYIREKYGILSSTVYDAFYFTDKKKRRTDSELREIFFEAYSYAFDRMIDITLDTGYEFAVKSWGKGVKKALTTFTNVDNATANKNVEYYNVTNIINSINRSLNRLYNRSIHKTSEPSYIVSNKCCRGFIKTLNIGLKNNTVKQKPKRQAA